MHQFFATVSWQRDGHEWQFDGGLRLPASSSPLPMVANIVVEGVL